MAERAEIRVGLPEGLRAEAAALYLEAFGAKLGPILGRDARAERFLAAVLRPSNAVAALDGSGALLGVAGFHDEGGGLVGGDFADLRRHYGLIGALWRAAALMIFERAPDADILLMDGVVVRAEARGMGVGGALLTRIADHARETGRRAVRLEVVDTNPRARALYERRGFRATATSGAFLLRPVFGFSSATTMLLAVD